MNKKEFLKTVAKKTEISITKIGQVFTAMQETIAKALTKGDTVALIGFGSFKVVKRVARGGRNPKTGEAIKIPARKAVKFVVGKTLKEAAGKK